MGRTESANPLITWLVPLATSLNPEATYGIPATNHLINSKLRHRGKGLIMNNEDAPLISITQESGMRTKYLFFNYITLSQWIMTQV